MNGHQWTCACDECLRDDVNYYEAGGGGSKVTERLASVASELLRARKDLAAANESLDAWRAEHGHRR